MTNRAHFDSQVRQLQASLVEMGETAGKQFGDAVAALVARDSILAREVIARDEVLDRMEDDNEGHTIQVIALNAPVASDLRKLVAFLRVNTTIERVGDLSVNIAQAAIRLSDKPPIKPFVDIPQTYDLVRRMWDDSIQAFNAMDVDLADAMRERDNDVDNINEETISQLIGIARDTPDFIYQTTNFIGVSKSLERIADLSVDIADEVIYVKRGLLRHSISHNQSDVV